MAVQEEVSKVELAARSLDLTTALLKATSGGTLIRGAWEVGQWLGRERLNQYELLDCMEKSRGLAFANTKGQEFFDEVIRGLDTIPVAPLFLQQSGSLGRLMAGDPNLSWIVSTAASLFQHHRDDGLVTDKLIAFISQSRDGRQDEVHQVSRVPNNNTHKPEWLRVRAVLKKIVTSVWYNIVNAGCDTIPLPRELSALCSRGHFLNPLDFGAVISAIHKKCPSKAILRTHHLVKDVMLWLLLHFDGTIVVNVGGQVIYRVDSEDSECELEVQVQVSCPTNCAGSYEGANVERYKVFRNISGAFQEFLHGEAYDDTSDIPHYSGLRQKLYDIPSSHYQSESPISTKGIQILIKQTTQSIVRWLLEQVVDFNGQSSRIGFQFRSTNLATPPSTTTVQSLLKRVPALVNFLWGSSSASNSVVYMKTGLSNSTHGSNVLKGNQPAHRVRDAETTLSAEQAVQIMRAILQDFPILEDLVRKLSLDCKCSTCASGVEFGASWPDLKHGCLMRMGLDEVCLLLAHSIADGFGVDTASSVLDPTPIVGGAAFILLRLTERMVFWDEWFMLASCVYLGCPFQKLEGADGTAFAAVQYGNLVTQAPWLDISQNISLKGAFGLIGSPGRLGVLAQSNSPQIRISKVEDNFAIIETQETDDTDAYCSRVKKETISVDYRLSIERDDSRIDSDVILFHRENRFYRILLRIKAQNHWRTIDPSKVFVASINLLSTDSCRHKTMPAIEMQPMEVKVYDMDEVIGRWPDTVNSPLNMIATPTEESSEMANGTFHISHLLDTHFKKNVALGLLFCPVTVLNNPDITCSMCMFSDARKLKRDALLPGTLGCDKDRYIINVEAELIEGYSWANKLLTAS
jgi:hypothetical protein